VTITYDGTGGNKNRAVVPYLTFPRRAASPGGSADGKILPGESRKGGLG